MLGFGNSDRVPTPRLDKVPLTIFFGLEISELLAFGMLVIIMPLMTIGSDLPFLFRIIAVISYPSWAFFLFFVNHRDANAAHWMTVMIPFWLRQRHFHHTRRTARRNNALHELVDLSLDFSSNNLSYRWKKGADGMDELHVYENPVRPYQGWLELNGQPARPGGRLPS